MSIEATANAWRAIRDFPEAPSEKLVLLALADLAPMGDEGGTLVYQGLSPEAIAGAIGLSVERVTACLESLARRGLVRLLPQSGQAPVHASPLDCLAALHPNGIGTLPYGDPA